MSYPTTKRGPVTISSGNSKLNEIPNVSLTPCDSCPADAPCKSKCYASKAYRNYPSVKKCWDRNTKAARTDRDRYFSGILHYLTETRPSYFRWHVAGDILDADYLRRMYDVARATPATRHLAFTKRHSLDFRGRPRNMSIVLSLWPNWGDTRKRLPRCWVQDGTETRIPDDALPCHGSCESCGLCWHLPVIGHDVVIQIH